MTTMLKAMAFDVDPVTLVSLQAGLPGWEIEVVEGATAAMLMEDWSPGTTDLFIVQAVENDKRTLELCAFLADAGALVPLGVAHGDLWELRERRRQMSPLNATPLFVLVPARRAALVRALLREGAASCLVLPIEAHEVASVLARARRGNEPGRHTLNFDQPQIVDRWRDDGGEG